MNTVHMLRGLGVGSRLCSSVQSPRPLVDMFTEPGELDLQSHFVPSTTKPRAENKYISLEESL
jgi:hypothetical protein